MVSMVAISNPIGRGRNGDEDTVSKTPNLGIALVCDQTLQYITLYQASFTKVAGEPGFCRLTNMSVAASFPECCAADILLSLVIG